MSGGARGSGVLPDHVDVEGREAREPQAPGETARGLVRRIDAEGAQR